MADLVAGIEAADVTPEWTEHQARLAAIARDMDARTLGVLVDQAEALRRLVPAGPATRRSGKNR